MKEIRQISKTELRADEASRTIEGYAVRYEEWSRDLGGFIEIIRSGAISEELIQNSDVVMNINHDNDKMVARSKNGQGTLQLEARPEGIYFAFDAPPTPLGDELLYNVRTGNFTECSFAFTVAPDSEKWTNDGGQIKREIKLIDGFYDTSIVTHAAYPTTSVSARGEEMVKNSQEIENLIDNSLNEIEII